MLHHLMLNAFFLIHYLAVKFLALWSKAVPHKVSPLEQIWHYMRACAESHAAKDLHIQKVSGWFICTLKWSKALTFLSSWSWDNTLEILTPKLYYAIFLLLTQPDSSFSLSLSYYWACNNHGKKHYKYLNVF